jgi:hypothetical protein
MDGAAIQVLIEKHGNTLGGLLVRKDPISKRNMMLSQFSPAWWR